MTSYSNHQDYFSICLYKIGWDYIGPRLGFNKSNLNQTNLEHHAKAKQSFMHSLRFILYEINLWPGFRRGLIECQRVDKGGQWLDRKIASSGDFRCKYEQDQFELRELQCSDSESESESDSDLDLESNLCTGSDFDENDLSNICSFKRNKFIDDSTIKNYTITKDVTKEDPVINTILIDGVLCLDDVNIDSLINPLSNGIYFHWWFSIYSISIFGTLSMITKLYKTFSQHNSTIIDCLTPKLVIFSLENDPGHIQFIPMVLIYSMALLRASLLTGKHYRLDLITYLLASEELIKKNSDPIRAKQRFLKFGSLNAIQNCLFYKYSSTGNQIEFRPKPNRNIEDIRLRLEKYTNIITLLNLTFAIRPFFALLMIYCGLYRYDFLYIGCNKYFVDTDQYRYLLMLSNLIFSLYMNMDTTIEYSIALASFFINDIRLARLEFESRSYKVEKALIVLEKSMAHIEGQKELVNDDLEHEQAHDVRESVFHHNEPSSPTLSHLEFVALNGSDFDGHKHISELNAEPHQNETSNGIGFLYQQRSFCGRQILRSSRSSYSEDLTYNNNHIHQQFIDTEQEWNADVRSRSPNRSMKDSSMSVIDAREEIADFQCYSLDFLETLVNADKLVSRIYMFMYVFWFIANISMVIRDISQGYLYKWTIVKTSQIFLFPLVFIMSVDVINLARNNEKMYLKLCSFTARDTSYASKLKWIGLLRYYNGKKRYGFTLFGLAILNNNLLLELFSTVISIVSFMTSAGFLTPKDIRNI